MADRVKIVVVFILPKETTIYKNADNRNLKKINQSNQSWNGNYHDITYKKKWNTHKFIEQTNYTNSQTKMKCLKLKCFNVSECIYTIDHYLITPILHKWKLIIKKITWLIFVDSIYYANKINKLFSLKMIFRSIWRPLYS